MDIGADPTSASVPDGKYHPPPYHVAAVYSKRAAEFSSTSEFRDSGLQRTNSSDSGFKTEQSIDSLNIVTHRSSPSRDSGRGPSIEPPSHPSHPSNPSIQSIESMEPTSRISVNPSSSSTQSTDPSNASTHPCTESIHRISAHPSLSAEQDTPLALKRATYIIESNPEVRKSAMEPEAGGELQSVAALRQAAREVFLSASPKASPIPAHKHSKFRMDPSGVAGIPLSAANVVGLPISGSTSENSLPPTTKQSSRLLPPPKYSGGGNIGSPSPSAATGSTSRIPLASHNRLPSGLLRQSSNLSTGSSSHADEQEPVRRKEQPEAGPKLSAHLSASRIPAPQIHVGSSHPSPSTRSNQSKSYSSLPPRMATPTHSNSTHSASTPCSNNNYHEPHLKTAGSAGTRIPLPKGNTKEASGSSKLGPSPVGSRIPTRLPTPTSATSNASLRAKSSLTSPVPLTWSSPRLN